MNVLNNVRQYDGHSQSYVPIDVHIDAHIDAHIDPHLDTHFDTHVDTHIDASIIARRCSETLRQAHYSHIYRQTLT